MKTIFILWLAVVGILVGRPDGLWQAPFEVSQPGMVRLELSPAVLDVSRPDLGDVRIFSQGKKEVPYLIESPARNKGILRDSVGLRITQSGTITTIEVSSGTSDRIEAVELVSPGREFLKSVTIEGCKEGSWQTLATHQVIFRSGGVERLQVPIPTGSWANFRFTVDDGRSPPVPFTGVRIVSAVDQPDTVELPVVPGEREEKSGETRLTLDLGAQNLNLAELRLQMPDAIFSRKCSLGYMMPTADGESRLETFATGTIYRVVGERGVSTEELAIPIHQRIPARFIVATFRNGDSPPLAVESGKVRCYPTILAFHAGQTSGWGLITGNRNAVAAAYDLSALRESLTNAGGQFTKPGPLSKNSEFVVSEPLPGVTIAGAKIDLAEWARQRQVQPSGPGVIQIELDAKVLAGSRTDLGDLRLVQNGRQIPYLVRPNTVSHLLKPIAIISKNDLRRPSVSRWEISLPLGGVPILDLIAHSFTPLFTRRFVAVIEGNHDFKNASREELSLADWTKSGRGDAPLNLVLNGQRLPAKFILETDNRDNPPITLDEVVLRFAAPSIIAKLSDAAPLLLCYANPKAAPPQYDLQVVRHEILAAAPRTTTLGDEEVLRPEASNHRAIDAGSPWLWLALAGVVVVLLLIVSKLLPSQNSVREA